MALEERTAVVTGAGSGIGRAIALALAAKGARVAAVDLDEASARETVAPAWARAGDSSGVVFASWAASALRAKVAFRRLSESAVMEYPPLPVRPGVRPLKARPAGTSS